MAPALPARLVSRPHLIDQLGLAADGPVTVVSAAAGWGKTTLLSSWVRETDATTAWVTVERGDDSADFWAHLHEALSTVSGVGARQATGPDPRLMPRRSYLCRLADVLAHRGAPVVVVLDNLDLIDDRTVPEELDFVVRHAQGGLRLVVAARTAPPPALHLWRLSGDLIEINSADLAFTRDEATQLLADHDIELPAADVDSILERTGGWATGLTLLAQAVRGHADPARWADQFSGDEATVAEYLDLEVLAGQPPHIRRVLLSTSVARRLNGSLVNALTDRTDGDRLLSDFVQCNLFTRAVADEPGWYRYHPMFADLLRSHLRRHMPGQHAEMHRRAAAWHAEHGLAPEALRHALVAGDRRYAATVVADQWPSLVLCRAGDEAEDIEPLAEDAFRDAPDLALAYAADRLDEADPADTDGYLDLVDDSAGGEPSGNPARLTVLLTALRLARAHLFGEPARVTPLARQLLALLSDGESDQHLRARAAALTCLGSARLASGELAAAERTLADGVRAAERARLTCVRLTCAARLSVAQAALGALRRAEAGARVVLHMTPCRGGCGAFSRACAYLALAMVHYERDHLPDAERYLDAAQACSRRRADPFVVAAIATVRIALLRAQNQLPVAFGALRAARRDIGPATTRYLREQLTIAEADLRTCSGDTGAARALLAPMADGTPSAEAIAVSLARACLREGAPAAATAALPAWTGEAANAAPLILRLEAGLLSAVAEYRGGHPHRAFHTLERVLELAEPEGFRRAFTRADPFVRRLLADQLDAGTRHWALVLDLLGAADEPVGGDRLPALAEPLTDREITVLRRLQGTQPNQEIAADLSVSVNTIKTHVRSIYRKLDVRRRRDAVTKAREFELI